MSKRQRAFAILHRGALPVVFAVLLAYVLTRSFLPAHPRLRPMEFPPEASWISAAGDEHYTACLRKEFPLRSRVKNAWLAVAPDEAFEITINGNSAGRQLLLRPTRAFQSELSEGGQRLNTQMPSLGLNFPREYQWSGHANYALPVFLDLTPYFEQGNNVIAIELESRHIRPRARFSGEIQLWSGEVLSIRSDTTWKATVSQGTSARDDWTMPKTRVDAWGDAVVAGEPAGKCYVSFPSRIYSEEFRGALIRPGTGGIRSEKGTTLTHEFRGAWILASRPDEACLRIVSNRSYHLFINGHLVSSSRTRRPTLDAGEWLINNQRSDSILTAAEVLDPDEVGDSLFVGRRFETPRHGNPAVNDFKRYENTVNLPVEPPKATVNNLPGTRDDDPAHGRVTDDRHSPVEKPETRVPLPLTEERGRDAFHLYEVAAALRKGVNEIVVRVVDPAPAGVGKNWSPSIAMDGAALASDGTWNLLATDGTWTVRTQEAGKPTGSKTKTMLAESPLVPGVELPRREFAGHARDIREGAVGWMLLGASGLGGLIAFRKPRHPSRLSAYLLCATAILATGIFLEHVFSERSEMILFRLPSTWLALAGVALGLPAFGFIPRGSIPRWLRAAQNLPQTRAWPLVIFGALLICFAVRAWKIDFQPLDDDEYASTQAVLAIAQNGVPKFVDGIWYTRSPFYHYLTGAVVAVFGDNLWALRLPSVLFGVATAWLVYLCGKRMFGSKWIGFGALTLYALHPFLIFSAHTARFYQQQQFFALLTVYFFERGFVQGGGLRFRYGTVAAFLAAVLSQEISAVLFFVLLGGYALFARERPFGETARIAIAGACAVGLIALDVALFKTKCLTRLEGVSPNLEAAVHLHFWEPMNFFTLFLGYSRLHLLVSVFFALGFLFALRDRRTSALFLCFIVLAGVVATNVLVTGLSLRYQYWLIPPWLLLAVYGMERTIGVLCRPPSEAEALPVRPVLATIGIAAMLVSFSPWRLPASYETKLLGDSTGAFQFVRRNLRPGDRIAATEPHPHASLIETGRADYDLAIPLLHDFVFDREGTLVDRNAGAEAINSIAQIERVCATHRRVWFVVNREKFRSRGRDILWDYPGARAELFLRENMTLQYRTYLWSVFLWDQGAGEFKGFRKGGV